ncbi:MAG TPA: hypothetical protein DCS39_06825 [Rhodobiaceae bacterium]|nr:hypothetical protein [Rhodobiaceae bacterium]
MNVQIAEQNLFVRGLVHAACNCSLLGRQGICENIAALATGNLTTATRLAEPVIISCKNIKPDSADKKCQKAGSNLFFRHISLPRVCIIIIDTFHVDITNDDMRLFKNFTSAII